MERTSQYLKVNNLNFHVVDEGSGSVVVLLHGFPNTWNLWKHQMTKLVESGYRVIVPDQRGFGQSDKPTDVNEYQLPKLASDVIGILDELKIDRAHLVGHDWGSVVGWVIASLYPKRIKRFVPLSVGHPSIFTDFGIEQLQKSWYILLFQFEHIAEEMFKKNDWSLFREWTQHHPETEAWIQELSKPGALTAGLNWYRANLAPEALLAMPLQIPPITVPTLGIWSTGDNLLTEDQMKRSSEKVIGDWWYERIEASHWLQLDEPETINRLIIDFIKENPVV